MKPQLTKILEENQIYIKEYGVKRRFQNFNDWISNVYNYVEKIK